MGKYIHTGLYDESRTGIEVLATEIIAQACRDYITFAKRLKSSKKEKDAYATKVFEDKLAEIKRFIRSDWCGTLLAITGSNLDQEDILIKLRRMYDER